MLLKIELIHFDVDSLHVLDANIKFDCILYFVFLGISWKDTYLFFILHHLQFVLTEVLTCITN